MSVLSVSPATVPMRESCPSSPDHFPVQTANLVTVLQAPGGGVDPPLAGLESAAQAAVPDLVLLNKQKGPLLSERASVAQVL